MIEYPKIETVWMRDERSKKVLAGRFRLQEFMLVRQWFLTEKIDGTNIRIGLTPGKPRTQMGGRTEAAQIHTGLLDYLQATFPFEKMADAFWKDGESEVTLFGEGYGPKIQRGEAYSKEHRFRLFDAKIGEWWLEPHSLTEIAETFGINTVPSVNLINYPPCSLVELRGVVSDVSRTAKEDGGTGCEPEGIVARTVPMLFTRRGERLVWKLKTRDFA